MHRMRGAYHIFLTSDFQSRNLGVRYGRGTSKMSDGPDASQTRRICWTLLSLVSVCLRTHIAQVIVTFHIIHGIYNIYWWPSLGELVPTTYTSALLILYGDRPLNCISEEHMLWSVRLVPNDNSPRLTVLKNSSDCECLYVFSWVLYDENWWIYSHIQVSCFKSILCRSVDKH